MHQSDNRIECPHLQKICQRVREKSANYDSYDLSANYNDLLKAFFDLAQEYDSLEDFYLICVAVPLEMTGLAGTLYLHIESLDEQTEEGLQLVCDSQKGLYAPRQPVPSEVYLHHKPYETETSYLVPIYSKAPLEQQEEEQPDSQKLISHTGITRILGMYSVSPLSELSDSDRFFFTKYANRIGYNLHNRMMAIQNIDHLKFINTLVMDIEHNVIVPNMYFRYLFNQLHKKISEMDLLRDDIQKAVKSGQRSCDCEICQGRFNALSDDLHYFHHELVKHHANISLFLESLFRREHFERGHLVLHPKRCFVEKEIILPQLEHYASRLQSAKVAVERPDNMLKEEFQLMVDVGLLAQVYANLFSNAAKYAMEVYTHEGNPRKAVTYGREMVDDFPEPGKRGVKFNVFTTGPHLTEEEGKRIFQEGIRGWNSQGIPGTGHGLSFIRHVVELHGGIVGYEATHGGNNFYFILPAPPVE